MRDGPTSPTDARAPTGAVSRVRVAWKAIALPAEHGGWGFLLEPLALGLALVPTWSGAAVALGAVGAFLARHPLRLLLNDLWRRRASPRMPLALRFAAAYGGLAVIGIGAALAAGGWRPLLPLLAAAPLGLVQLAYDARNRGREVLPEIVGAIAPGALAAALALEGSWTWQRALPLWLLLAAKSVASVVYVRARLRLDRGGRPDRRPAWGLHFAALALSLGLAGASHSPWLGAVAFVVLTSRALFGLSRLHRPVRPQVVGFQEVGFGLATVVLLALGYSLRL